MLNNLKKKQNNPDNLHLSTGFTIVELVVVIIILGIIATIGIVSYNGWKKTTVITQLKSDLKGAATAMENSRNFNNMYPEFVPSIFKPSQGNTISGGSTDGETYSIDVVNSQYPTEYYHISSGNSVHDVENGKCITAGPFTLTLVANPIAGGTVTQNGSTNSTGTYEEG